MARQLKDGPANGAWQWSRTVRTQRALLDAARQVFTERGFSESSIAVIVERAGSSVGSLYHHFGGKSELFIALWQEHQLAHEQAASQAVAEARKKGVTDPGQLFEVGARAFLHGSWQRRDLVLLFSSGDAPPGFEVMRRGRSREWISQNDSLLHLTDVPADRVYAAILTSLIGEGAYEVAACKSRRQAEKVIDAVAEYARRLMAGGPWRPAGGPQDRVSIRPAAGQPIQVRFSQEDPGPGENKREDPGPGENKREDQGPGENKREDQGPGENKREDPGFGENKEGRSAPDTPGSPDSPR